MIWLSDIQAKDEIRRTMAEQIAAWEAEEDRLARLLARTIKIDLFHFTDGKLREIMTALDIDEPQDMVTRLIHCAHMMDRETLARLTDLK